jgi:hypothetical protein
VKPGGSQPEAEASWEYDEDGYRMRKAVDFERDGEDDVVKTWDYRPSGCTRPEQPWELDDSPMEKFKYASPLPNEPQ